MMITRLAAASVASTWQLQHQQHQLPPIEAFYSSLTQVAISEDGYVYTQTVWETFNIPTLGGFHDLYLLTYILLLWDVFDKF